MRVMSYAAAVGLAAAFAKEPTHDSACPAHELVCESITLAVSAKANALKKAGVDVVGFGAGEPDFDTPAFIKEAAKAALDKGQTKYTPTPCIPELKAAIAEKFNKENGLPYKPENITTGAGGKHCLYMAFMAVLNPGDEVHHPLALLGELSRAGEAGRRRQQDHRAARKPTASRSPRSSSRRRSRPRPRCSSSTRPSNPGGHAYTPEELKALADVVAKHPNVIVFSDEIYEKLVYDGLKFVSFATLHPQLCRADADLQLPLQDLRHDRLAHRLHRRAQARHRRDQQAAEPDDQPHHQLHADAGASSP